MVETKQLRHAEFVKIYKLAIEQLIKLLRGMQSHYIATIGQLTLDT